MQQTHKKKKKKTSKVIQAKAKKKEAVARATIKKGTGKIKINKRLVATIQPEYIKKLVLEPVEITGEKTKQVDINVTVSGGGFIGQTVAVRGAIAKALVKYFEDKELKQKMLKYDRLLLVDDSRRKEAKKPLGKGARRKKQKSKR